MVATTASLHFYSQADVDGAVSEAGRVRVWRDEDEWSVSIHPYRLDRTDYTEALLYLWTAQNR